MAAPAISDPADAPDPAAVLAKATRRAAEALGMTQRELAAVLGASEATVSRLYAGRRGLDPASKEGELGALLVRVFRSLDALVGGDAQAARAWMRAPNAHLGEVPIALLARVEGLVRVAGYLDAMRGTL